MSIVSRLFWQLLSLSLWIISAWMVNLVVALIRLSAQGGSVLMLKSVVMILGMSTEIFIMRLVLFLKFTPVFMLLGGVGLVDGLVQRDLRRFSGSRESALFYHQVKRLIMPLLKCACFLYLVLPLAIATQAVLLPAALLGALTIASSAKHFKKYV